jgi:carbon-monoxide dehydrogenase large subunit
VRVRGNPSVGLPLSTVAVLSNPLRYAFDKASQAATQFVVGDPDKAPVDEDDEPGLEGRDFYSPAQSTFANGMHAVVVETDPETAEIRILRYCVVHDCGNVINPMIVEGQVHGGVAQGVGGALYERMAYDADGQLQNASFMDFLMPYATEVPRRSRSTTSRRRRRSTRSASRAPARPGVIPGMAAFASAIEDAEGFRISAMPDLAERPVRAPSALRRGRGPRRLERLVVKIAGTAVLHAPPTGSGRR